MLFKFTDAVKSRGIIRTKAKSTIIQEDITGITDYTDNIDMKSGNTSPSSYRPNKYSCFRLRILKLKNYQNYRKLRDAIALKKMMS